MSTGSTGAVEQALAADASLHDVLDLVDATIESSTATGDGVTLDRLAALLDGAAADRGEGWSGLAIAATRARAHAARVAVTPAEPPLTTPTEGTSAPPGVLDAPSASAAPSPIAVATEREPYAGSWLRVLALGLDSVVLLILYMIVGRISGGGDVGANLLGFVLWGLPVAYFAGMHAFNRGATAGKALVGISVLRTDGRQLGVVLSLWHFVATLIVWLTGIGGLVDIIVGATDDRNQWVHDKMARTIVVHKRSRLPDIL